MQFFLLLWWLLRYGYAIPLAWSPRLAHGGEWRGVARRGSVRPHCRPRRATPRSCPRRTSPLPRTYRPRDSTRRSGRFPLPKQSRAEMILECDSHRATLSGVAQRFDQGTARECLTALCGQKPTKECHNVKVKNTYQTMTGIPSFFLTCFANDAEY